jgi:hypothetical protein
MEDFNPYESPRVVESPVSGRAAGWDGAFASAHTRAVFAMSLLGVTIFTSLLAMYSNWLQYSVLDQMKHGIRLPTEVLLAGDRRHATIGVGVLIVFVLTVIAFLMWTYRAYKNLPALGAKGLEHTPGWAVGWYFVPIANLAKPYSVTAEIVRHSNPEGVGVNARAISTANVGRWWATYIISGGLGWMARTMINGGAESHSIDSMMSGFATDMVGDLIRIVAAVFAIMLISQVDKNQERRFQLISEQQAGQPHIVPNGFPY